MSSPAARALFPSTDREASPDSITLSASRRPHWSQQQQQRTVPVLSAAPTTSTAASPMLSPPSQPTPHTPSRSSPKQQDKSHRSTTLLASPAPPLGGLEGSGPSPAPKKPAVDDVLMSMIFPKKHEAKGGAPASLKTTTTNTVTPQRAGGPRKGHGTTTHMPAPPPPSRVLRAFPAESPLVCATPVPPSKLTASVASSSDMALTSDSLLLSTCDPDDVGAEDNVRTVVRPTQQPNKKRAREELSTPAGLRMTQDSTASTYATPLDAIFQPDEPLTATQEAWAAEGYIPPTPPPLFFSHEDDDEGEQQEGPQQRGEADQAMTHSQRERVKVKQWAQETKAFFEEVDKRGLLTVDPASQ